MAPKYSYLTAIAGRIGSGKSVVAKALVTMGYMVYDCDSEARRLMENSASIMNLLVELAGERALDDDGKICRPVVAEAVFSDATKLARLNSAVHSMVIADLHDWCRRHCSTGRLFVETALLNESGLDGEVAGVWHVVAPPGLRIERVMARSGLSYGQVRERIAAQNEPVALPGQPLYTIVNDNSKPVLPQILGLLNIR